ncbi:MAG TPA: hypothetical protein VK864_12245 [Longimicrobiales bacterium]|nr:hypothetical protein [Longimicrobiales bacterium]
MNPNDVAPMVLGVAFFVVTGGVLLLRPITKRLGTFLEVLAEERRRAITAPPPPTDEARLVGVLEILDRRLARLEERQAFTDELLATRKQPELPTRSE